MTAELKFKNGDLVKCRSWGASRPLAMVIGSRGFEIDEWQWNIIFPDGHKAVVWETQIQKAEGKTR